MNKWYRSAPVKGVLLLVQHVLVVLAVISLVWLAAYPGMTQDIFSGETETSYANGERKTARKRIPKPTSSTCTPENCNTCKSNSANLTRHSLPTTEHSTKTECNSTDAM